MECLDGALKSSLRKEMVQQASPDHLWVVDSHNAVSCDDFFVDDLLDLSNEDAFVEKDANPVPKQHHMYSKDDENKLSSVQQRRHEDDQQRGCDQLDFSTKAAEISVPSEDIANLEWLSHFVEDSFSATPFLTGVKMIEVPLKHGASVSAVPAKARSKRSRTGGRVWSLGSASLTESTSSSSSSCSSPWLIYAHPNPEDPAYSVQNRTGKKLKKAGTQTVAQPPRRCSHCGVQKTPQWRTGPLGAKTLCNACGVRFKSGRLLPEYRPACSPTFSTELHSNHHRKVLEMRQKKDSHPRPDSGLGPQAVTSF